MKLYDYNGAPNPRRVKIFAAEKDIQLELIQCDLAQGEHKTPEFITTVSYTHLTLPTKA